LKNKTYIYYGIAAILVLAIFLFLPTKKKLDKAVGVNEKAANSYSLKAYNMDFIAKQSDSIQLIIHNLQDEIANSKDSLSKVMAYTALIDFYNKIESSENAALVVFEKAKLINNPNSWAVSGDNFIHLLMEAKVDTTLVQDIGQYAIQSFENSIQLDSSLVESKIKLAQCYMELANEPMKGVQMLLGVVKADSNNVQAQFMLAKFGLVSGQFEKVMGRLEKVLSLQPQNIEARLMRVDAQMQLGKTTEAVRDLKTLKAMKTVPVEMKKQLELAIVDIESKQKGNNK
jgi:hypothetical protein